MKYAGVNLGNSEPFTKYLNQIRNQLSHGAPRVWDSVIYKKDGIENDLAVDVGRTLQRLEEVVQVAIVKLLNETG